MISILENIRDLVFGNKRYTALRHFAKMKGFSFARTVLTHSIPKEVLMMKFFEGQKPSHIKGLLSTTAATVDTYIFDFDHLHAYGRRITTVFVYHIKAEKKIPNFRLSPRSAFGRLGSVFSDGGWADVDPKFDKAFTVESDFINEMNMMVTIQFAEAARKLEGMYVESINNYISVHTPHRMVDTIDMDNIHFDVLDLIDVIIDDDYHIDLTDSKY